jgi:predicted phage gp36 major capsid-like protein
MKSDVCQTKPPILRGINLTLSDLYTSCRAYKKQTDEQKINILTFISN